MANVYLKAEKIAATAIGLLQREIVLPGLVWRNAGGDFKGAAGDTITMRVPARTAAKTRNLRAARTSSPQIEYSELTQLGVDVTLDVDIYNAVKITDEELTLDIVSFAEDILAPQVRAIAEGVENKLATEMTTATYEETVEVDSAKPHEAFIDARKALNDANVPVSSRVAVVGSEIESMLLKSDYLVRVDHSGSDSALRDAQVGRVAGVPIYVSNAVPEDFGVVFHSSAFVLNLQVPAVPAGAAFGATQSYQGLALRWIRDYDPEQLQDRSVVNVYCGTNHVTEPDDDDAFVRAVKLTVPSA